VKTYVENIDLNQKADVSISETIDAEASDKQEVVVKPNTQKSFWTYIMGQIN